MLNTQSPSFLRNVLLLDAAASGATGLLLIAGAGFLDGLLGLPVALLREAGLILLPYVAFVVWVATRETISRGAVRTIVAANVIWALASAGLLVSGLVAPTACRWNSSSRWPATATIWCAPTWSSASPPAGCSASSATTTARCASWSPSACRR